MESAAVISYWVRFALVVLAALVAIVAALRRSRAKAAGRDVMNGVVGAVAVAIIVAFVRPAVSYMLVAALLLAGVAVGFGLAKVRPLIAWVTALTIVFAVMMALFGEALAFGAGVGVMAFGAGLPLGQGLRGAGKKAAPPAEAAPQ